MKAFWESRLAASSLSVLMTVAMKRSEEHTSKLQSRLHLVCRLLLEKKKIREHPKRGRRQDHQHRLDNVDLRRRLHARLRLLYGNHHAAHPLARHYLGYLDEALHQLA